MRQQTNVLPLFRRTCRIFSFVIDQLCKKVAPAVRKAVVNSMIRSRTIRSCLQKVAVNVAP